MPFFQELVLVGRVVKPHGRHGEVAVEPISDRPERFPALRHAFLPGAGAESREVVIERVFPHKRRFVLKIAGVDSIEEAEALRGLDLRIAESELARLPEGSFYHHELFGLRAVDTDGSLLGRVEDVLETGAPARVLVIRGEGAEILVPFAEPFIKDVDLVNRSLVVRRPEYVVAD